MLDITGKSVGIGDSVVFIDSGWGVSELRVGEVCAILPDYVVISFEEVHYRYNRETGRHDIPIFQGQNSQKVREKQFVLVSAGEIR